MTNGLTKDGMCSLLDSPVDHRPGLLVPDLIMMHAMAMKVV